MAMSIWSLSSRKSARARTSAKRWQLFGFLALLAPAAFAQLLLKPSYPVDEGFFFERAVIDGDRVAMGLRLDDDRGQNAGAVQIFLRTASGWVEEQKLTASDGQALDFFGESLSLDGDRILIGAPGDDDAGENNGAAYLFERSGGVWQEIEKFLPQVVDPAICAPNCNFMFSGNEVQLAGDYAYIAAWLDPSVTIQGGAIEVRKRNGGTWPRVQKLNGGGLDPDPSFLGAEFEVSGDWLAASSPTDDPRVNGGELQLSGSIFLWEKVGGQWRERQRLVRRGAQPDDVLGRSGFALEGSWLMAGFEDDTACDGQPPLFSENPEACESGAVVVFRRQGNQWLETQTLRPADNKLFDRFGFAIDIEGSRAVIGAWGSDDGCPPDAVLDEHGELFCDTGAVYVYELEGDLWVEKDKLVPCDVQQGHLFGQAVDLDNGRMVAVAAGLTDNVAVDPALFLYDLDSFCSPDDDTMCLNTCRFQVEVEWTDFNRNRGPGTVVPFGSDDSGMFWFFTENNWEMLVKILNGCGFNDRFWVFSAATTNVEYTMTVTDTATGQSRQYRNPLGTRADAITDTGAFATCDDFGPGFRLAPGALSELGAELDELATAIGARSGGVAVAQPSGSCSAGAENLCLNGDRFRIEVSWRDFQGNTGSGRVVPFGSDDSGLFYFFRAENWEMLVKVLDGCGLNDRFWVFSAATTNVEYQLRVTDTKTGESRSYENPLGVAAPALTDTSAFATCP